MAGRQNKVGLDYFELDCHMDEKIELIEAEFGLKGFAIVVKLYQSIYSGFGYYCEWTPDISLLWAMRLGVSHSGGFKGLGVAFEENSTSGSKGRLGNALEKGSLSGFPDNLINGVVAASIRRGIFNRELFEKYHILTSSGIQKRYLNAVSKREKVEVKKEYLLFSIPKNQKNVVINSISDGRNSISAVGNEQSKEEKSKEENIYSARASRFNDFFSAYPKQKNVMAAEKEYMLVLFNDSSLNEQELINAAKNYAEAVSILGTEERYIKNPERFLKDGAFLDYLNQNYTKPNPPKKKGSNQFNQFPQREYDFDDLEKRLLSN